MQMKNLKVEELSSQEMKNIEGGFWWLVAAGFGMLASYAIRQTLSAVFPTQDYYYY
ncbi:class IIb bacteriocin, lactobin A/cerein 7B family [Chryseobacterium nematophagum]|uniref:Class IIb bacteriocin, lactobin A/cerein 7B family n=1 Tax=Chryseobacterium nematophagum TaxID=2305228 RepID=A0A3M7L7B2_9FLAO|nr:class IIb bacteriocin, lactobin A/cerein 7B family [Chryseobacterium nematophagum]RMZ58641.1 class IIb bacteriocin, lactobin A/cerein 7B family [Chryseobacterium nematophagum]